MQPPAPGQAPLRHIATPENYVVYGATTPMDEDEVREAVEKLLLGERAPPALLKVVGRAAYDRCARMCLWPQASAGLCRLAPGCCRAPATADLMRHSVMHTVSVFGQRVCFAASICTCTCCCGDHHTQLLLS